MSLLATIRQDIRTRYPSDLDRDELRYTKYGLMRAVEESMASPESIISADVRQKALDSVGTDMKIPVFNKGSLTVSNTRSCTIGDFENTTAMVDVVWTTYRVDISMIPAQYGHNEIAMQDDLRLKLELAGNTLSKEIEDSIDAKLEANKSIIYNSSLVGALKKYTLVGDALQVALADQELFFNDVDVIMEQDDFYTDNYVIAASTDLKAQVRHYRNQGASNDENLQYQFGDKNFRFSNHVTNVANSTGFIFTPGSIGMLTRVDRDSIMRNETNDAKWFTDVLPSMGGVQVGVLEKSVCYDGSAVTGNESLAATKKINWSFSLDVALLTPYNQNTATFAGVIKKFEYLNA